LPQGLAAAPQPDRASRWRSIAPERKHVVMWGAADQARVNRHILAELGCEIVALIDDSQDLSSPFPSVPLFNGWTAFEPWLRDRDAGTLGFVIAIGNPYGHVRCRLQDLMCKAGIAPLTLADPSARLCKSAILGPGLQVMAGTIVHNEARIGRGCIINTRALVEHDCVLEDGVEIGPGAVLCGRVHVGANTWIGAGACVRPRIRIGRNAIVGAGAVVVDNVPDGVVAVGVPATPIPGRSTPSGDADFSQSSSGHI